MRPIRLRPAVLALVALATAGCHSVPRNSSQLGKPEPAVPPAATPSSNRTYLEALQMAKTMTEANSALWIGQVSDTGSMAPYLGEASLVVVEPVKFEGLQARVGSLVAYRREGSLFLHVLVETTPRGVVVKGASADTLELVPYDSVNGIAAAVLYFDRRTAPTDRSGVPVLLASTPDNMPLDAGEVRIVGAAMISGDPATIYPFGAGTYKVQLHHGDVIRVDLGVPGDSAKTPEEATITASDALVGHTVDFQIYPKDAPEAGHIVLTATFVK